MSERLISIKELQNLIKPVAVKYGVERISLFGSYARGDAKPGSDIDLRVDKGSIRGYFKLAGFHRELEETLDMPVDVVTSGGLDSGFLSHIGKDEVVLYEHSGH